MENNLDLNYQPNLDELLVKSKIITYKVNFDKVETFEDLKLIIKQLDLTFQITEPIEKTGLVAIEKILIKI